MDMPNVLWIFVDEHRGHAMSCAGDTNIETPCLDSLAANGVYFPNSYSNAPICTPARGCVYTGQYATTHGAKANHYPLDPNRTRQMAQVMQDAGYYTGHFGKWHLAGGSVQQHLVSPYFRPGWNDWIGWECMHGMAGAGTYYTTRYQEGDLAIRANTIDKFQTDWLTDRSVEWMQQRAESEQPWFHCVSIETPHPPLDFPANVSLPHWQLFADKSFAFRDNVPQQDRKEYETFLRGYYSHIANIDDNVQRMIDCLKDSGQLENTIIMYFADHGEFAGSHARGGKGSPLEESSRIPYLVRLPQSLQAPRRAQQQSQQLQQTNAFFSLVDLMPSTLGLCNIPIPQSCQGRDLSKLIRSEDSDEPDFVYMQFENGYLALDKPQQYWRAIRNHEWMLGVNLEQGYEFLFNMVEDPYQLHNLIGQAEYQPIQETLLATMRREAERIHDPFFIDHEELFSPQHSLSAQG